MTGFSKQDVTGGRAIAIGVAAVLLVVMGWGLWSAPSRPLQPDANVGSLRLGVFLTLSGPEATFGTAVLRGIRMAVEDINAGGGVGGHPVELVTYDVAGKDTEVVRVVNQLAVGDKVHLLLGEVTSNRSLLAAPLAQSHRIPMITPTSTHPAVTKAGNYIFRVSFTDVFQGQVLARFAVNALKLRTAAVYSDGASDYSRGLGTYFENAYGGLGGRVIANERFASGTKDHRTALKKLLAKRPEILFLPVYYADVAIITKQARELGFDGVFLGGDGWDSDTLTDLAGEAVVGSYFSNHFAAEDRNPQVRDFVDLFSSRFGKVPGALNAMGYDAARVAADAFQRAGTTKGPALQRALQDTRNFPGVTGIISMNERRDAVKPAVVLRIDRKGAYQYVRTINP